MLVLLVENYLICAIKKQRLKQNGFDKNGLSYDEKEILSFRTNVNIVHLNNICFHHYKVYGDCFEAINNKCRNLFTEHSNKKKKIKGQLRIDLELTKRLRMMTYNAMQNCYSHCQNLVCESNKVQHDECTTSFHFDDYGKISSMSIEEFTEKFNA